MPPEPPQPGNAQDWLRYATSDLELARMSTTPNVMLDYAVTCRYPGDAEPVTESDYELAVRLGETVLVWAQQIVAARLAH